MNPKFQLRTTQQQTVAITAQLTQSLRLLQLSSIDLEQEIEAVLAANPFLERSETEADAEQDDTQRHDDSDWEYDKTPLDMRGGVHAEDLDGDWGRQAPRTHGDPDGDDDADIGSYLQAPTSLAEHLLTQIGASRLGERDSLVAAAVVGALDDDGYLREGLGEIAAMLPASLEVTPEEIEVAVRFVQSLDPAGVAARSVSECLQLQLRSRFADAAEQPLALAIVKDHLNLLASHDSVRMLAALGCGETRLRCAHHLIRRLDPRPGLRFVTERPQYVVADVLVKKVQGRWVAAINPDILPNLHVNRMYAQAVRQTRGHGGAQLSQHLQEARWLVRNIRQRFRTIHRVAQAIVDRQSRFFEYGDLAMKPMILREVAQPLGLHESTVSRVTNGKYMATPHGLMELKRFFGSHVVGEDGHACSATAIRALIRHIIANEDADRPLSDIKVTRKLSERGVRVARRTVSKYRDAMRIPPVDARRLAAR